jgi:hypothetical protein
MRNIVLSGMHVWITFTFITLDLEGSRYSLLTEGDLIASSATNDESGCQVKSISADCIAHHLS